MYIYSLKIILRHNKQIVICSSENAMQNIVMVKKVLCFNV